MVLPSLKSVLFDLDGTLVDTAPDLAQALNTLVTLNGRPPLPFHTIRPVVGQGGKELLKLGFNIDESHRDFERLWDDLLRIYGEHICDQSHLFPGMDRVLQYLKQHRIAWGIVTNKPTALTMPLLEQLNLRDQVGCVVNGDTLEKRKPDPEPLWYACELLHCLPHQSIYIGDAQRDIQAGINAGMPTIAALYGYISEGELPELWGADGVIHRPEEIIEFIR